MALQELLRRIELGHCFCKFSRQKGIQKLINGAGWVFQSRAHIANGDGDRRRMKIKEIADELIGMFSCDIERPKRIFGKVF